MCDSPTRARLSAWHQPSPGWEKKADDRVQSSRTRSGSSKPGPAGIGMIVHFAKIREKLLTLIRRIRVVFSHPARVTLSYFPKMDSFARDMVITTCIVNEWTLQWLDSDIARHQIGTKEEWAHTTYWQPRVVHVYLYNYILRINYRKTHFTHTILQTRLNMCSPIQRLQHFISNHV